MARQTVFKSDLTGRLEEDPNNVGRLVIKEHPEYTQLPVELDVLPDEIEGHGEAGQFVGLEYYAPGNPAPQQLVMRLEDFNSLTQDRDMDDVIIGAIQVQERLRQAQLEAQQPRRRGRPRKDDTAPRPTRVDYASLEHAGEPHRGRITDAEKQTVREHLDEINRRLRATGLREIDPTDPKMQERYGLNGQSQEQPQPTVSSFDPDQPE